MTLFSHLTISLVALLKEKKKKISEFCLACSNISGSLQLFLSCTGKWCLKGEANQRCHLDENQIPPVTLLSLSMCNYSLCAVSEGLFPLSVPRLFVLDAKTVNTQISCVALLCLSRQRGAPVCATAMEGARWTKTAGTVFASQGGEEQDATWPWRPSALTARTMREVRDAEQESEPMPELRSTSSPGSVVICCPPKKIF